MRSGVSVYYLLDPRNGSTPRAGDRAYVGYTKDIVARLKAHLAPRHLAEQSIATCWLRSLVANGITPTMSVRCVVQTADEAKRIEIALITALRLRGMALVNATAGGDGVVEFRHTDDAKQRIGEAWKGKRRGSFTAEHRQKLSVAARRRSPICDQTRIKLSVSASGRTHTAKTRALMRRPKTIEHRAKIAAGKHGISNGPLSQIHRDRISASGKRAWVWRRIKNVAVIHPQLAQSTLIISRSMMRAQQWRRTRERLTRFGKQNLQLVRSMTTMSRLLMQQAA